MGFQEILIVVLIAAMAQQPGFVQSAPVPSYALTSGPQVQIVLHGGSADLKWLLLIYVGSNAASPPAATTLQAMHIDVEKLRPWPETSGGVLKSMSAWDKTRTKGARADIDGLGALTGTLVLTIRDLAAGTTVTVKTDKGAELFSMNVTKSLVVKNGYVVGEPLTGKMTADALPWLLNAQ
jgi:hypothetical protein